MPFIWADSWALPENLSPSISRPFLPQPHVASAPSLSFLGLPFLPLHSLPLPPSVPLLPLLTLTLSFRALPPSLPPRLRGLIPSVCPANEVRITTSPCADHMLLALPLSSPLFPLTGPKGLKQYCILKIETISSTMWHGHAAGRLK